MFGCFLGVKWLCGLVGVGGLLHCMRMRVPVFLIFKQKHGNLCAVVSVVSIGTFLNGGGICSPNNTTVGNKKQNARLIANRFGVAALPFFPVARQSLLLHLPVVVVHSLFVVAIDK